MKTTGLKIYFLSLISGISLSLTSQSTEFTDLRKYRPSSFGEIIRDNSIQGYYILQKLEKLSKNEAVFEVTLMDNNLRKSTSFEIRRPKNTYLLEAVFNDEVFVFHFYDMKSKALELVSMDRTGKKVGSYKVPDPYKGFLAALNTVVQNELEYTSVYEMGASSFLYIETIKNKDIGFKLQGLDNNMKKLWTYSSSPTSKFYEGASVLSIDEKYTLILVTKKKALNSVDFDSYLLMLDSKTGEVLYNFQMLDKNRAQLSVLNGFVNDETGDAYLIGEYYAPGDDVARDKSLGLYIQGVDIQGDYILTKKYSRNDIARVKRSTMSNEELEVNKKDVDLLYFHRIIRAEHGHIYVVAEQYVKQFSAGGAALALMGGETSLFELLVTNMVVIEFDKDLNMTDFEIIGKKPTNVILPSGAGYYSAQRLGAYVKATGGFDYAFTTEDKEKNQYLSVYSDSNRKEEDDSDKSDAMVGVISISEEGIDNRRVPLNSEAKWFRVSQAKPGYVLIEEYYRKERKLVLRMEKVQ